MNEIEYETIINVKLTEEQKNKIKEFAIFFNKLSDEMADNLDGSMENTIDEITYGYLNTIFQDLRFVLEELNLTTY